MNWNEILQISSSIIVSLGGAGAIILGFSSYIGNIWATRYTETIRKDFQIEIEKYKTEFETLKERTLRYSGQQFELYKNFWISLQILKSIADKLWDAATVENLKKFSEQLKNTIEEVEKSSLFIEDVHYFRIKEILNEFNRYEEGKTTLIKLYHSGGTMNISELENWINYNRNIKHRYEELLIDIRTILKHQISGTI